MLDAIRCPCDPDLSATAGHSLFTQFTLPQHAGNTRRVHGRWNGDEGRPRGGRLPFRAEGARPWCLEPIPGQGVAGGERLLRQ
ncbi:hypothetical protein ACFXJJ_01840, partial [Streptomyces sp. NPDC059233]